ncbi:MAG: glycosyltransferase family 4 protein [Nitrososphaeria archaeon]
MAVQVLVVTPVYYPEVGGGALATYLITDLLARTGQLRLTVLTGVKDPKRISGVKYIYDPLMKLMNKQYFPTSLLAKRYQKVLKKHDIIYVVYAFPLIPLGKAYGKKVIVHLHDYRPISPDGVVLAGTKGSGSFRLFKDSFTIRLMQKKGVKDLTRNVLNIPYTLQVRKWVGMADTILAVSKRHAEIISTYLSECRNKIKVQYNPLPQFPETRKNLDSTPTFLYIGGESYLKGFHILLKSMRDIIRYHKVKFLMAGSYGKTALKAIDMLNRAYGEKIYVFGKISHRKVFELHEKSWALLFPSIIEEPMPYTVLESLTIGTLPIASKVGGVVEIVEKTCARDFLVTPGKPEELSEAIKNIANYSKDYFKSNFVYTLSNEFREKFNTMFNEQELLKHFLD